MIPRPLGVVVLALAGAGALAWALSSWSEARAAAHGAAADLAACQSLEQEILALREQPRQAQAAALESPEMARRIEQAAQKAGIDKRNLERIAPQEPHRVKESVFLETPTQIKLDHVTLGQLITFLHTLNVIGDGARDLRVDAVRMNAPRGGGGGGGGESDNTWTTEITVCYLVYAPKTEPTVH
jgi:hypothetical protein